MRLFRDMIGWVAHGEAAGDGPPDGPAGHRIIRASGVTQAPVFSASGERCGRIFDLSIDKRTGRIVYALISVEGDLGLLSRVCPAPWNLLRYDAARGGYAAPAERADLTAGPPITPEELRRVGASDSAWQDRLAIYYNP
ncbi:PRC-barrel domain-containing protein [Phenylobacterium sp.]|uniref:PRC-barrel domain-containing protein n=1 Tax=Phenylobacterium sp. TaxID=1871053 RepID=UPI002FE2996F